MKSEIKIEFSNSKILETLIQKSYFKEGQLGRLSGKDYIEVTPELDDIVHTIVKGLNNATIKITNNDIIDGTFRFIIEDKDNVIKLFPISIFCVEDDKKYFFY